MMIEYSIEENGLLDFSLIANDVHDYREEIHHAMKKAADDAAAYMRLKVPYSSGDMRKAVDVSEVNFDDGEYEVSVGIDFDVAPHALFVFEGTGIYGEEPNAGIFPANGNVMIFEKKGEGEVYTKYVAGQKPQRDWYEESKDVALAVLEQHLNNV